MKPLFALWAAALAAQAPVAGALGAFIVDDRSFFANRDHVFLDFETRGDGTPLSFGVADLILMPPDEYTSVGLRFATPFRWIFAGTPPDPNASFSNAVEAAGSWPTIVGSGASEGTIEFLTPVRAFGMGVVQVDFANTGAGEPPSEEFTSTITAFDALGAVLGRVTLWTDTVDGGFGGTFAGGLYGDEWSVFNYGFLGLATETPIARLEFTNVRDSIIDDLHFSAIPAPGAGVPFGLLTLGALARRRRATMAPPREAL